MKVNFDKIEGLVSALEDPEEPVCSNYSFKYCQKTEKYVKKLKSKPWENAYFTFPTGPVKCAGAPQKIMYLAHEAWHTLPGKIHFTTAIDKMFAVPKYKAALVSQTFFTT